MKLFGTDGIRGKAGVAPLVPAFLPWYLRSAVRVGGGGAPVLPTPVVPIARRAFSWARATNSIVNSALAENINGVRTVQEMNREDFNFKAFSQCVDDRHANAVQTAGGLISA